MRIEIAGALAVGKSTLCAKLEKAGFHVVTEDLSANPYLELRNEDPEKYGFLAQQSFVEHKVGGIVQAVADGHPLIVSDYCLAAEMAYVSFYVADRPDWIEKLAEQIAEGEQTTGKPDAIVYLRCPADEQLARIRSRGRGFEQGLDVAFIETINGLVDGRVREAAVRGVRVIEFDSRRMSVAGDRLPDAVEALLAETSPQAAAEPVAA